MLGTGEEVKYEGIRRSSASPRLPGISLMIFGSESDDLMLGIGMGILCQGYTWRYHAEVMSSDLIGVPLVTSFWDMSVNIMLRVW